MKKEPVSAKTPRSGPLRSRTKAERQAAINTVLASLDALEPTSPKAVKLFALLRSWLTDESGYDERTWPKLKKALDDERDRAGARRLFDD